MKYLILVVFMLTSLIACEEKHDDKIQLKGTWIETGSKTDTLIFNEQVDEGQFTLNREREIRNGYILPKSGSGIYDYSIKRDSIILIIGLSSSREAKAYFFNIDKTNEIIEIGNFYKDSLDSDINLCFQKQ